MTVSVFPTRAMDWLKHELDCSLFRRAGVIKSGAGSLESGTVLGRITMGTAAAAAKAGGNTGAGALTLDATTPVLAGAKIGVYTVRCIAAATDGGTFRVEDPDGNVIGDVAVGATFADDVKFVIADGAPDFVVGDGFDITVEPGSYKYVPVDFAANDGSQIAAAVVINAVDATAADAETAVLTGNAQIVSSLLTWPSGATSQQKSTAIEQLAAIGVVDQQRY